MQSTEFEPVQAEPNGFLVHRLNQAVLTDMLDIYVLSSIQIIEKLMFTDS